MLKKLLSGKKLLIFAIVLSVLTGILPYQTDANAAVAKPAKPKITLSSADNGTTLKITVSKTKRADGYRIYYKKISASSYKYINVNKNGNAVRKASKKNLTAGTYSVYAKAYRTVNDKKYWSAAGATKTIELKQSIGDGIVLEFSDGSKVSRTKGDKAVNIKGKNLKYVYLGQYPQTEVSGKQLTSSIKNAKYDKNGIAVVDGVSYKRLSKDAATYVYSGDSENYFSWTGKQYAYFKFEPIKWRVLKNDNGNLMLFSEYGIDEQEYDHGYDAITWEKSSLRNWLNNDFMSVAFSTAEKKMILSTDVVNGKNPKSGVNCGNNTKDNIYILSYAEALNMQYGFKADNSEQDLRRRCVPTDYAKAMGAYINNFESFASADGQPTTNWWLRSQGSEDYNISTVSAGGYVDIFDIYANDHLAVRPIMNIDLTSVIG